MDAKKCAEECKSLLQSSPLLDHCNKKEGLLKCCVRCPLSMLCKQKICSQRLIMPFYVRSSVHILFHIIANIVSHPLSQNMSCGWDICLTLDPFHGCLGICIVRKTSDDFSLKQQSAHFLIGLLQSLSA